MITRAMVAYHEAGHAVMAVFCGIELEMAVIQTSIEEPGYVLTKDPLRVGTPGWRRSFEDHILMCLAGGVSQLKGRPARTQIEDISSREMASLDGENAKVLAKELIGAAATPDSVGALISEFTERVMKKFDDPATWSAVEAVARALDRQSEISGEQVRELMKRATNTPKKA